MQTPMRDWPQAMALTSAFFDVRGARLPALNLECTVSFRASVLALPLAVRSFQDLSFFRHDLDKIVNHEHHCGPNVHPDHQCNLNREHASSII